MEETKKKLLHELWNIFYELEDDLSIKKAVVLLNKYGLNEYRKGLVDGSSIKKNK